LNVQALSPFTTTNTSLVLRDGATRQDAIPPNAPSTPTELPRRAIVNPNDEALALQQRKSSFVLADSNSKTQRALNTYQQTATIGKRDEWIQLFGVDLYV
jgi:hypothetical protein